MKISKAIKILTDLQTDSPQYPPDDRRDAIQLGIKGLKRVKDNPFVARYYLRALLPGEDKDSAIALSKDQIKKLRESPLGRKPKG